MGLDLAKTGMEHVGVTDSMRHELVHVWSPDSKDDQTFDTVLLNAIVSFYKLREDKHRIEEVRNRRAEPPSSPWLSPCAPPWPARGLVVK